MTRKRFKSREQVFRIWSHFLDEFGRRAWDRPGVSQQTAQEVNNAAGQFFTKLGDATRDLPQNDREKLGDPPQGSAGDVDKPSWNQFAVSELADMVAREDICSVTDAILKTTSLLRVLQGMNPPRHRRFLFRGQKDIRWDLKPKLGRALCESGWTPPNSAVDNRRLTYTHDFELDALREFQAKWDSLTEVDELDRVQPLDDFHAAWWFRMQHYDQGNGTRLLDMTTSPLAALLFACVDWSTGLVDDRDDAVDGVIYLWAEGTNGNVTDYLLRELPNAPELFTGHTDAPVYILNPPHNERSKAQSGAFFWWPRFWEPPPYGGLYYLRVIRECKRDIVSDLLSMGFGPKEAVRGIKGLQNEQALRQQLGFSGWRPLGLSSIETPGDT